MKPQVTDTHTHTHIYIYLQETGKANKNLSDMFPIRNGLKQGDAITPMLFNFASEYAIRRDE